MIIVKSGGFLTGKQEEEEAANNCQGPKWSHRNFVLPGS